MQKMSTFDSEEKETHARYKFILISFLYLKFLWILFLCLSSGNFGKNNVNVICKSIFCLYTKKNDVNWLSLGKCYINSKAKLY